MLKIFTFARRDSAYKDMALEAYMDIYEQSQTPLESMRLKARGLELANYTCRNFVVTGEEENAPGDSRMRVDVVTEYALSKNMTVDFAWQTMESWNDVQSETDAKSCVDTTSRSFLVVEERVGGIPLEAKSEKPFKVFMLVRRRQDLVEMPDAEYVNLYESLRVPLARRLVEDGVLPRYVDQRRNYVRGRPRDRLVTSVLPFDLILQATYQSQESYEALSKATQTVARAALYEEDSPPFDASSRHYFYVRERQGHLDSAP